MRLCLAISVLIFMAGCGKREDGHGASYEAGRAAHEVSREAGKAAVVLGRKLDEGARNAHTGWEDQARIDREKKQRDKENRP